MSYLIYDEDGELFEVMNFQTPEEIKTYKQCNPSHTIEMADPSVEEFFLSNIDDDTDFDDLDIAEEDDSLW
jgi:hypothetical protein